MARGGPGAKLAARPKLCSRTQLCHSVNIALTETAVSGGVSRFYTRTHAGETEGDTLQCEVRCSVLQCVAVCCSVVQCVAVRCIVLQHEHIQASQRETPCAQHWTRSFIKFKLK